MVFEERQEQWAHCEGGKRENRSETWEIETEVTSEGIILKLELASWS